MVACELWRFSARGPINSIENEFYDYMEKVSTRVEFQLKFSSRFMSPEMRSSALSTGMKYPIV
jgi:hypothetical protein